MPTGIGMRRMAALLAFLTGCTLAIAAGQAASAATWKRVTSLGSGIDEVSTLRLGVLHVAWNTTSSVYDTRISRTGKILGSTRIVSGWALLSNPALVRIPGGGLNALWGGMRTTEVSDPNQNMNSSVSMDSGKSWTLTKADVVNPNNDASGSPVSAANEVGTALTPIMTWYSSSGVFVHAGLSSSTPNYNFHPFGCCGYYSNVAVDGTGQIKLAWFSNASGHLGLWTQSVGADGSKVGSPLRMPGTGTMSDAPIQRVGLVARAAGGFYVAFPTGSPSTTKIVLWRVGSKRTRTIARVNHTNADAGIATDARGRLWVFWDYSSGGHPHVYARRSNRRATKFGAVVRAGAPPHAGAIYSVDGNASSLALDVFANTQIGNASRSATWTRHIYPGLTLRASRRRLAKQHRTKVTFRVSDAGSAVKGATVHIGHRSVRTNSHGKVTIFLTAGHRLRVTATHSHYAKASLRLRVS